MFDCFSAEMYENCSFEQIIYHDCLLFTTRQNIDELCIGKSPREMSDFRTFSQSLAVDVVETKTAIGQIVLALKVIRTDFSSELFTTIVCYSQHVEI